MSHVFEKQATKRFSLKAQFKITFLLPFTGSKKLLKNIPAFWINPVVIVPKQNIKYKQSIRVCIDMRTANSAVVQELYQVPILDEILHTFNGCNVFYNIRS